LHLQKALMVALVGEGAAARGPKREAAPVADAEVTAGL